MNIEIFQKFAHDENLEIKKILGKGGFGIVYEVKVNNNPKPLAAKLIKRETKLSESDLILEFRGPNIVKVNKIYEKEINKISYYLILMEKAPLKDLKNFISELNKNILRYVFKNPFEMIGDNFARFIIKQLMKGFETLYMGNYAHFDFKPENVLIFNNMTMKLTDFGLLRNLNEIKDNKAVIQIPGGTLGYFPPEKYSKDDKINFKEAQIYDYFSLGATIFYLKYGKKMLKYMDYKDNLLTANYVIDLIQKSMDEIKVTKSNDKDFIEFLCKLIQFNPEKRLSFEGIYRNKWLNKNREQISEILEINILDEEKIIAELDKSDFLIEKNKYIKEKRQMLDEIKINNKGNMKDNDKKDNKNYNERKTRIKTNYHKFKFKL